MKAIIFDLDGVLCSTDEYHYQAWKALADRLRIPFDRAINDRLRGVSRMASLEILLEKADRTYPQREKLAFAEEKNERYRKLLARMSPGDLTEEVRRTLDELRCRGYKLAVGSSSKNAKFILRQIGLGDYFDAVSDGTNITRSKPDPEVFLKAADYLGTDPAECLVVEDAVSGIEAAKAAGMTAAGIGGAAGYEKTDIRLDSIADLLRWLAQTK